MREVTPQLADQFRLTEQERQELMRNGQNKVFSNRVAWAKSHLKSAGLIENPVRGKVRLSDEGRRVLGQGFDKITCGFLKRFPSYLAFIGQAQPEGAGEELPGGTTFNDNGGKTPLELLDSSYRALRKATADDLLSRLKTCSPAFFEHVVVKLLLAMGYGGVAGEGSITGRPGDGGIDGVI